MQSLLLVALFPVIASAQSTTQVVEYYTTDALGSVRAVTKRVNGVLQVTRHDFMPFGEEVAPPIPPQEKRLFTGKERDTETELDYFGARYYRADVGRFTTVDPLGPNPLRLVNPQRLAPYAYAINNPLKFIDPDGRDAIVVNFSQGGIVSGRALGHAGVAAVFADGSVKFSDFGPSGDGGLVRDPLVNTRPALTAHVEFGIDGMPTSASLEAVAKELEALQTAPRGSVQLAYFKTSSSDTAALSQWIDTSPAQWQYGLWAKYVAVGRNCGNYVREGMSNLRGFGAVQQPGFSIPNLDFLLFRMLADRVFTSPKATVTTEITGIRLLK